MNWDYPPRSESPAFIPNPLPVRPRKPLTRQSAAGTKPLDPRPTTNTLAQSSNADHPLHTLCHSLNVAPPSPIPSSDLPSTYELALYGTTRYPLPTHLLAIYDAPTPSIHALASLIPIDGTQLTRSLRADILGSTAHSPRPVVGVRTVRVPVVPLHVPHAPSIPTLLLFSLGLRNDARMLATSLLPPSSSEALPSVSGAAHALASVCTGEGGHERMVAYVSANQGVWKNALALGPRDESVMAAIQLVWNITAEAKRLITRPPQAQR